MADREFELPFNAEVDSYGSRILRTESGQEITYEEAFKNEYHVNRALQIDATDVPKEFTMFVLRKTAVSQETFRGFEAALPQGARAYLLNLIGHRDFQTFDIHPANREEEPSTFRGTFVKIFCKKVICNSIDNQRDVLYDDFATIFPIQVHRRVRAYRMEIVRKLDDNFYQDIQTFLSAYFDRMTIRVVKQISIFFLLHIRNFIADHFSAESLLRRLENPGVQQDDYLSNFPRLHAGGIRWFRFLYREFDKVREDYRFDVSEYYKRGIEYDAEYFRRLPERNFADLYSFFDYYIFFQDYRETYTDRFKKYLFFFVHALRANYSSRRFFIDDMLFECVESLPRYKRVPVDVAMKNDLAKITLLHYRLKFNRHGHGSRYRYYLNDGALRNIKKYLLNWVVPQSPQLNVVYRSDLGLLTWMSFRTNRGCFNISYSSNSEIKNFSERLLCSVLCPDEERVDFIVHYNAYLGSEVRYVVSRRMTDNLKNFIRLCNRYDFTNETVRAPDVISRILEQFCLRIK